MASVTSTKMSLEEFNALPERERANRILLRGQLVDEFPETDENEMTLRNQWHALVEAAVACLLRNWIRSLDEDFGKVYSGEVGCELRDVETFVGIDVAVFTSDVLAQQDDESPYIVGAPLLAVEILSPSDTQDQIHRKVKAYLDSGTAAVWTVSPGFKTLTVHTKDGEPKMYSGSATLTDEAYLPGFELRVAELFE